MPSIESLATALYRKVLRKFVGEGDTNPKLTQMWDACHKHAANEYKVKRIFHFLI